MTGHAFAMVFDLNKCLGCQTCTVACKTQWTRGRGMDAMWWCIVNTVPGRGTPQDVFEHGGGFRDGAPVPGNVPGKKAWGEAWDFEYDRVFSRSGSGDSEYLRPRESDGASPTWGPNWDEDLGGGEYPNSYFFYLPLVCMNCENPPCVEACPRSSVYQREEDGVILIDEERCHGYRYCVEACPYKRIYFNQQRVIAQKCIACYPRLEAGVAPACVRQCPGRVVHVGHIDDPDSSIHKLVHTWKVALPLRPDFETRPRVFYVPPTQPLAFDEDGEFDDQASRFPIEELRQWFGPSVDQALAVIEEERQKVADGGESELMDILISRNWQGLLGPYPEDPGKLSRPTRHAG